MTARDDFELVKWAVAKATELPAHEQGFAAADAFDRLFTPRQLRELVADGVGFEPTVTCATSVFRTAAISQTLPPVLWCCFTDLNREPPVYKTDALPIELKQLTKIRTCCVCR